MSKSLHLCRVKRNLLPLTWLGAVLLVGTASSSDLSATGAAHGFVIHDATETLNRFTVRDADGLLWLSLPGGARFELVTSIDDPAIANRGDGAFHSFEVNAVRAALTGVSFPIETIHAEVFILPYPRRGGLESAAGDELILLSPGVLRIPHEKQHAELVHELGHVVQRALLPDNDVGGWDAYRRLRGIQDPVIYSHDGVHANRPHEIFAEDFRFLFGGAAARYSGTIENHHLPLPTVVPGLRPFLLQLGGGASARLRFAAYPNPSREALRFSQIGAAPVELDLFDAAGRRIMTLEPRVNGNAVEWQWNRQDPSGRRVGPGVVFARLRDGQGTTTRVTLLP